MEQCVGVIADAHGNLPALEAAVALLDEQGCTSIIHIGDAIGIGPYPAEVVQMLQAHQVRCLMGNHDEYFADGLPKPIPAWMSPGEVSHQRWVHSQCSPQQRDWIQSWPYSITEHIGSALVQFVHYPLTDTGTFASIVPPASLAPLLPSNVDIVLFGHDHRAYDTTINDCRCINPGSLGCYDQPIARAVIIDEDAHIPIVRAVSAPYDPADLLDAFDQRGVPERDFLRQTFMPQR